MIYTRIMEGDSEPRMFPKPYKLPPDCPICGSRWYIGSDGKPAMTPHDLKLHGLVSE